MRDKNVPLMRAASTWILFVANSTPMVDLDSRLNSFRVNLDKRFDFPTPESPINTTTSKNGLEGRLWEEPLTNL